MTPEEHEVAVTRLRTAFDLFEAGERMMRQKLRREHPDATDREIEEKLLAWLCDRPGAEHGDAVGRPKSRFLEREF